MKIKIKVIETIKDVFGISLTPGIYNIDHSHINYAKYRDKIAFNNGGEWYRIIDGKYIKS